MIAPRTELFALVALALAYALPAGAQTCTADDFGVAVDSAGAQLRAFNADASPKLQARLKALAAKMGWSDQELEDRAITELQDARLAKLDETANTLLARVDTLGQLKAGETPDCAKLEELKTTGIELLTVMKTKSSYLLARIDAELGTKTAAAAPAPAAPTASPLAPPPPAMKDSVLPPVTVVPAAPPAPKSQPKPEAAKKLAPPWTTSTATVPVPPAPPAEVAMVPAPIPPPEANPDVSRPSVPMNADVLAKDDGYTIDEIRDATEGFFGGVSTGLASVIEHAFRKSGRPTGYVLGQEGGGAFLGGLRYGEGTLYVRTGGTQKIFWHGPSVGFDFGAAGARTLFLVYKMREPGDLYRVFTGIDGSAFVVGGVGLTLLGGGDMVLAPIRSGLGIRVGANIGYLRFTPAQTWNPF